MLLQYSHAFSGKPGVLRPGLWHLGVAFCSVVLGFCSTMLITRTLGPAAFGTYSFVLWLATIGIPAIGVGMSTMTSRHVTEVQGRETPRLAAGIFFFIWKRQYWAILLYCVSYFGLIFPLSWYFGPGKPVVLLFLAGLSAPPLLLSGVASITLRSLRRFDLLASIHLLGALSSLLMVIIVAQIQEDQIGYFLLASAAASLFMLTLSLICIARLLPLREALSPGPLLKDRLTRGFSNSLLLFILDAVVWQRSELLLLGRYSSAAELGFYALSSTISIQVMNMAPTLLSSCVLPLLLRYVPDQYYFSLGDAFFKTTRYTILLSLPICILAILLCPYIITFCFGAVYLPVVLPLRVLLVSAVFGSISTVSLTHLANGERKRAQTRLGLGTAVLKIVLLLLLIAPLGITGAAIASAIAQILSAAGSILICKRLITGSRNTHF